MIHKIIVWLLGKNQNTEKGSINILNESSKKEVKYYQPNCCE